MSDKSKVVDAKLRLPAALADWLQKVQERENHKYRNTTILFLLRDAQKRDVAKEKRQK